MAKRRRLLNPAAYHRRMIRERELRRLRVSVELYAAQFESLVRSGDARMIRRMMECRAITHLLLEELMPDVPQLIEAGELQSFVKSRIYICGWPRLGVLRTCRISCCYIGCGWEVSVEHRPHCNTSLNIKLFVTLAFVADYRFVQTL
jgi:hypothetical protein